MNESIYKDHYKVIAPLIMGSGVGDGRTTACVMAQAATIDALRKGKSLDEPTDEMECACPVLRRLAIRLNDTGWWRDDMKRTEALRPLIPLLLDSRGDKALTMRRVYFMVDKAVRELAPMRLQFISKHTKDKEVKKSNDEAIKIIKGLNPIIDKATAEEARIACGKLKKDASAYIYTSDAAYAAAYIYAYADVAYTDNADADVQKIKYRDALLSAFKKCAAQT